MYKRQIENFGSSVRKSFETLQEFSKLEIPVLKKNDGGRRGGGRPPPPRHHRLANEGHRRRQNGATRGVAGQPVPRPRQRPPTGRVGGINNADRDDLKNQRNFVKNPLDFGTFEEHLSPKEQRAKKELERYIKFLQGGGNHEDFKTAYAQEVYRSQNGPTGQATKRRKIAAAQPSFADEKALQDFLNSIKLLLGYLLSQDETKLRVSTEAGREITVLNLSRAGVQRMLQILAVA